MTTRPEEQLPASKRRPFHDVALASGLVTAEDLAAAAATMRGRPAAVPQAKEDGQRQLDTALAAMLVEQGKLTSFQAREILAGRTRFRLGQYTVIDEVGRGGMGQVFRAEHALMGRHVAVKVLPRSKATPESEAAFRREMRILGRLDHENLVRAFDAGYDAMVYYLVTELVPGIDLRRQVRTYGPLNEATAASVFSQVARGLAFAHQHGLVHRDVKPGNILVMDDGRVKVLDLGLAGSTLEAEALRLGRVVGTMDYIAPEQIRTPDDVGPAADIYALGCSMYFALTGEVPFPGGTRKEKMRRHLMETPVPIQRLAPQLPLALCRLVEALMAKSAADRIGSADEVIRSLARWTPERPVALPRLPAATPAAGEGESPLESFPDSQSGEPNWPVLDSRTGGATSRSETGRTAGPPTDIWTLLDAALGQIRSSRIMARAAEALVPAVLAGIGFTVALHLVRRIDPDKFDSLFGTVSPESCGWVAFFLISALLFAAHAGHKHR